MNRRIVLLTFVLIVQVIQTANLGSNLLINHDFSYPNVTALGVTYAFFPCPILGWNCTSICEMNSFDLLDSNTRDGHFSHGYSSNYPSQAFDTSPGSIDVTSQVFFAKAG